MSDRTHSESMRACTERYREFNDGIERAQAARERPMLIVWKAFEALSDDDQQAFHMRLAEREEREDLERRRRK